MDQTELYGVCFYASNLYPNELNLASQELNIPDRIKAMAWVGPTKICLGFSGEYALMDVETKVLTELFAPSGPPDGSGPMSTLNSLYNMSIGSRGGKPLVTKIPNNEMLLAKDREL